MIANEVTGILIQGINANEFLRMFTALETAVNNINQPKPAPKPETTLLTRKEVAQILKVSLVTLHHWSKKGLLTPHRIGNKIRFNKAEVLKRFNEVKGAQ